MNKRIIIIGGFFLIILLSYAVKIVIFSNNNSENTISLNKDTITVTTSFYPLYFFAKEIGGDKADIVNITPAGSEPHDYDPTPANIVQIEKSKLLILNGAGLELWGDKIRENLKGKKTVILTMEEEKTVKDPHVWLSPLLAKKQVEKITQGFEQVDSTHSSYYQGNAKELEDTLDALDKKFKDGLRTCKQKDIITSHAAFGYLAQSYGFNQVAISGLSPDEEPPPSKLAEVAKFAKENTIKYIFFESLVSPKLSQTIAKEVGAKSLVLNPIEGLTPEEMQAGKNYSTLMEENLSNLKLALECQ